MLTDHIEDIIQRYTEKFESMQSIADHYGYTRQAVYYALKRAGIDTSKANAANIQTTCAYCSKSIMKRRNVYRKTRHSFCNWEHYDLWLKRGRSELGNKYIEWAQGRRAARKIVSEYIELLPGYIVHHEDRNQRNNAISNLKVFACQGDHNRYHRGFQAPIVWDGEAYIKYRE